MPKLSKTAGIELIVAELQKGTATADILGVIRSKWELPESTFYRWLEIAKKQHEDNELKLNAIADDTTIDEKIEAQKKALNEATERKAILQQKFIEVSKVKRGKVKYKDQDGNIEIVKITLADELKAIDTLAKLDDRLSKADGTDKPTKQDLNVKGITPQKVIFK